jgi:N utilization substance protein B
VLLVRDLSTDASPAFVNGLLARIADLKPSLTAEPAEEPAPVPPASPEP